LRQAARARNVEQAAEAERRIQDEAASRLDRGVEAQLKEVVGENSRFLEIRVQIVQSVVHRARRQSLDDFGGRMKDRLIEPKERAV